MVQTGGPLPTTRGHGAHINKGYILVGRNIMICDVCIINAELWALR